MAGLTLSVSQVAGYIKGIFDAEEMLIGIKIVGELTNLKPSSKAIYFDIKDDNSALPCVCFDEKLMQGFCFGDKVVISGKFNYYAKTGKLSFVVNKLEKYGIGELYKQYIELKNKLEKLGMFNDANKKSLPYTPKRVGVVTSETGSVIRDIIRVARKKNKSADIVIFPTKVQGVGSDIDIANNILLADNYGVDVIIVARGGGSFEDYQPFNTELVANAVYNCKTPIVSAIGHENDFSIIDFVADVRAGTPSIASEIVFNDEKKQINDICLNIKNKLLLLNNKLISEKQSFIAITASLSTKINNKLIKAKKDLKYTNLLLNNSIDKVLVNSTNKIKEISLIIENLNPISLLNKGYTKTVFENGNAISDNIKINDNIKTITKDMMIISTVKKIEKRG